MTISNHTQNMAPYLTIFQQRSTLISLLISSLLFIQFLHTTADTPSIQIKSNCTGQSYTQNSRFATNLASLLSVLITKSSSSNSDTVNLTNSVYGLYMCQGDLPNSDCNACISTAAVAITSSCSGSRQGIIWYDNCELRYSDFNFFGIPDTAGFSMNNPNANTTSTKPFGVVTDLVKIAPAVQPLMFAPKALINENIYALAQCTVDLSAKECSECLNTILADIQNCCTGYQGWRYLATSCWVRYEATPFLRNLNGTSTEIVQKNCSPTTFAPNQLTTAESNLDELLANITVEAHTSGFSNTTIGKSSNQLYGLALCRGDLIPPNKDCDSCLKTAAETITGDCPNSTGGIEWYEKCMLRYSNQNFFGLVDLDGQTFCGVKQITQAASDATIKLAASLVRIAENSTLMVAAQEEDVGSLSSYVLVQCTRDLSSEGCKNCLEKGLNVVGTQCNQTNGWRYLSGSCTLRYEVFQFYNTSAISSSPAPELTGSSSQQEDGGRRKKFSNAKIAAIIAPVLGLVILGLILYYLWWKLRRKNDRGKAQFNDMSPLHDADLPLMDLAIIQVATNNFSDKNKLGEGGFGPVYKGIIRGGKEIAVKRLSKKSKQGSTEFKNEVKLIAKLQHRNLVKMLGCCIEREEKLLIYEFLPNKSLDVFLFDPNKRVQLHWNQRLQIIAGIAKGLLYLHEDSRLKVIHRDLKASNVLLDNEMNPKISDFGMAKISEPDESEANTNRIVGTYGYMAPEYAMDGRCSVKSDVYSFGVLLLEIISGEKNGRSHYERFGQTLLRHAWQLWNEDKAMELMDSLLEGSYPTNEAAKYIHIGLLCVQENSEERPTMSLVVHMLRGDESVMPPPAQPPTFTRQRESSSNTSSNTNSRISLATNELTESIIEPR